MRFHFRASFRPIFKNNVFRAVSESFHPLYEAKISNRSLSVVYGSITLKIFRGLWELVHTSGSTAETKFKKSVFLGHPTMKDNDCPTALESHFCDIRPATTFTNKSTPAMQHWERSLFEDHLWQLRVAEEIVDL